MNTNKPLLIIDTDPGHDDALAIFLVAAAEKNSIAAVTTVAGNATIQDTSNNARYLLDLIGIEVPLFSGAAAPLRRELVKAQVHGSNGLAGADITRLVPLTGDASKRIRNIVRSSPHEVTILALGPLTNIATAINEDPGLPSLIKEIVIMGGAIEVPGNKNRTAEFNIFVDPEAAAIVFDSGAKLTLVPLDVCNKVVLQLEEFECLRDTCIGAPVLAMMSKFIEGIQLHENFNGALVYDALAAFALLEPDQCSKAVMDVRVETMGAYTRGMTVADRRTWGEQSPNCSVITNIEATKFKEYFFSKLIRKFKC